MGAHKQKKKTQALQTWRNVTNYVHFTSNELQMSCEELMGKLKNLQCNEGGS
jgi:hypothetical protein